MATTRDLKADVQMMVEILLETKRAYEDPDYRCVDTEPSTVCDHYCRCSALEELKALKLIRRNTEEECPVDHAERLAMGLTRCYLCWQELVMEPAEGRGS